MDKLSDPELQKQERNNEIPRYSLLEKKMNADVLDERFLKERAPSYRRILYKWLPTSISQLIEALFILQNYDVILSQFERVSFPLTAIMRIFNIKKPHALIISRITSVKPKRTKVKIQFIKYIKNTASLFLIWSSNQRRIAIEEYGIDPEKAVLLKRGVDQNFWKPQPAEIDMICSVGMEARDYPTLVEALKPLNIPCHIAVGASRGEIFDTVKELYNIKEIPDNITIGPKYHRDLRNLYARSRFVVVTLMESDSDNGLTTILESMAMGKPVIVTRTEGQIDVIQDGVTGIFVPQGDPKALTNAISELWNNPEKCEKMGRAARKYIEEVHNLEQFTDAIEQEVRLVINSYDTQHATITESVKV